MGTVGVRVHGSFFHRFEEAGPSGAGFEFSIGSEERLAATNTGVRALIFCLPIFSRECRLSPGVPGYLVLLGRKLLTPFFVRFRHLVCLGLFFWH